MILKSASQLVVAIDALDGLNIEMTEYEIVQRGVDIAQAATSSHIAYLHFLNDDENTIELGVWSADTLVICNAVYARHYPVESAGIWADSARHGVPCIHNDYAKESGRKGLPEGHALLVRHLGLPLIDAGKVRLLVGVGNKATDYVAEDIDMLDRIARRIWSMVSQRRLFEQYLDLGKRFRHVQEVASVSGFEYDIDEDRLSFDSMFRSIFHHPESAALPSCLAELIPHVAVQDHKAVRAMFAESMPVRQALRIHCRRCRGEHFPAELKIEFRKREVGQGVIGVGILQDISEQMAVEDLRRRADIDPLTELPNRNRLQDLFSAGFGRRGVADKFAFHYIDLDDFKPVNDRHGHPVGDEVLRAVAVRLRQTVREDDLVVRMGGDEFAVVQKGLENSSAAPILAAKIIEAICEPIRVLGQEIHVGASIGVAISTTHPARLNEVSARADKALYAAKMHGGRRYVIEGCASA